MIHVVQVQVDLSDDSNRIIEIFKAQHSIPKKSIAIDMFISQFASYGKEALEYNPAFVKETLEHSKGTEFIDITDKKSRRKHLGLE